MIVSRIPISAAALAWGRLREQHLRCVLNFGGTLGPFIDFDDGTGTRVAFDIRSGQQLDLPPLPYATSYLRLLNQHEDESLFLSTQNPKDWIGMIQVRTNNQLLHEWRPPTLAYSSDAVTLLRRWKCSRFFTHRTCVLCLSTRQTGKVLRHIQTRFCSPGSELHSLVSRSAG